MLFLIFLVYSFNSNLQMHCSKCNEDVPDKLIMKHLSNFHPDDKDLDVPCPQCATRLHTLPMYRKHWYKYHHVPKRKPEEDIASSSKKVCVSKASTSIESEKSAETIVATCDNSSAASIVEEEVCGGSVIELSGSELSSMVEVEDSDSGSESDYSNTSDDEDGIDLQTAASEILVPTLVSDTGVSATCSSQEASNVVNTRNGKFVLKLRESVRASSSSVVEVMDATEAIVKTALQEFSEEINEKLQAKNVSLSDVIDINKSIEKKSNLFPNLKRVDQQNSYFHKELNVINPQRIPLGTEFRRVRSKKFRGMKTVKKSEEFMYVPPEPLMTKLTNHPDYKDFVENGSVGENSHFLDSYMKGSRSKINPVLRDHPDALRFILYYDDLEVCSPLKSRAGNQKIGAFYLFLDNIPYKYRSNLNVICLLALANANLLKKKSYGIDAAVRCIVEDLKKFEDGVVLNGKKVYGTLIAFIGDNLGSHTVGGFKEGFTATHGCRFCSVTFENIQKLFREDPSLLRDEKTHDEQCAQVQTSRGKNATLSTRFGVNSASPLNELKSFHVIGGMPPDCLHDVLEGFLAFTIKKLLKHILYDAEEKKFSLDCINKAARDLDFDYIESKDKPSELRKDDIMSEDTKLHQSGCQTWLLGTILPLIIGPYMSTKDKHYQNFLNCLEICRIIFSFEVSQWMVIYLRDLIEVYLSDFKSLYGHLIPKQHHLIHYPSVMLQMGSLMNYHCLRCEAKHRYFKKLVESIDNYKNIPWSLSSSHQLSQAYEWSKGLKRPNKCGPCSGVNVKDSNYCLLLPNAVGRVVETNWLVLSGNKFSPEKNCFMCVGVEESLPVFAFVVKVIIHPHVLFVCKKVQTVRRSYLLAAYEIKVLDELCLLSPSDMRMHTLFNSHKVKGNMYIAVKYSSQDAIF